MKKELGFPKSRKRKTKVPLEKLAPMSKVRLEKLAHTAKIRLEKLALATKTPLENSL